MKKVKWLSGSLVESPIDVGACFSEAAYIKEMKRLKSKDHEPFLIDGSDACCHFYDCVDGSKLIIVCMGAARGRSKEEVYSLLVHEDVHVWQEIKENIGEKYPSHEFEAYSIQGIALNLMNAYKNRNK